MPCFNINYTRSLVRPEGRHRTGPWPCGRELAGRRPVWLPPPHPQPRQMQGEATPVRPDRGSQSPMPYLGPPLPLCTVAVTAAAAAALGSFLIPPSLLSQQTAVVPAPGRGLCPTPSLPRKGEKEAAHMHANAMMSLTVMSSHSDNRTDCYKPFFI